GPPSRARASQRLTLTSETPRASARSRGYQPCCFRCNARNLRHSRQSSGMKSSAFTRSFNQGKSLTFFARRSVRPLQDRDSATDTGCGSGIVDIVKVRVRGQADAGDRGGGDGPEPGEAVDGSDPASVNRVVVVADQVAGGQGAADVRIGDEVPVVVDE